MVRAMTRHSVNGSGVSIPEQFFFKKNKHAKSADEQPGQANESHHTNNVCRFVEGYVLQLNPVTAP